MDRRENSSLGRAFGAFWPVDDVYDVMHQGDQDDKNLLRKLRSCPIEVQKGSAWEGGYYLPFLDLTQIFDDCFYALLDDRFGIARKVNQRVKRVSRRLLDLS
jgi:hypothetical protein